MQPATQPRETRAKQRTERLSGLARRVRWVLALIACGALTQACAAGEFHPAFSLRLKRTPQTPPRASVTIDDQYVGTLGYVGARGVRLRTGEHRISVEHSGYFPYDTTVRAEESQPVTLTVKMDPIPD